MHKPKLLSVVAALAFVAFALSFVERPEVRQATGYPQLVSVQDLKVDPNWCPPAEPALPEDSNLFATFGETSVHAGTQASADTPIITRPPIRTIRDKDPIYSAVAVDTRTQRLVIGSIQGNFECTARCLKLARFGLFSLQIGGGGLFLL